MPSWVDRLRPASFESPSGIVSNFKLDIITRTGGKKASMHEVLNSDKGIPQDQGNLAIAYPVEAYFPFDDGDIQADRFFKSLGEHYSIDSYGVLRHPRWGDIPVMPFTFSQVENLVNEGGIFRVTVEFRPIPLTDFPSPGDVNESEVVADVTDLEDVTNAANEGILVDIATAYAQFSNRIRGVVNIIKDRIGAIADKIKKIKDLFNQIQADIDAALAIYTDAQIVMSQVNRLMRLPGQVPDDTTSKVTAYYQMTLGIADAFANFFDSTSDNILKINNGIIYQSLTSMAVGATAEAAMFTDFQTRDAVAVAMDHLNNAISLANEGAIEISQTVNENNNGKISVQFQPDHNTASLLGILYAKAILLLMIRSFDLKAKQTFILSGPSDPITLTWKHYGDLGMLEFFILTNNLQGQEMVEMAQGREYTVYA